MNLERESDPALRALRQSHALLDERPSAATRERILEAAGVRSSPALRTATTPGRSIATFWRELTTPWLAGAAALGLVALLSIGVALHLEGTKRFEGSESTKIAIADNPAVPVQKEAVPEAAVPSKSPRPAASVSGRATSGVDRDSQQRVDRNPNADLQNDSVSAQASTPNTVDLPRGRFTEQIGAVQQKRATSSLAASDVASKRGEANAIDASEGGATALTAKPEASTLQAATGSDHGMPTTQNARVAGQPEANALSYRNSEKTWLERIRELRHFGLSDQADKELKLFEQSYPHVILPEDLRSP